MLTLKGQLTGTLTAQGHLSGEIAVTQSHLSGTLAVTESRLVGELSTRKNRLNGTLSATNGMSGVLSPRFNASYYHGIYEFVPGDADTTVHTSGQILSEDIVIKAIPSNYGKISWNGSVLTVS